MDDENHLAFQGLRGEVLFVLLTILYFVIGRFLAVLSHEVLGHGLASELIGGEFYAFYASPGPGFTSAYLPDVTPVPLHALYLMAGIITELSIGLLLLLLVYPRLQSFFHKLFGLLLLEALLIHSLVYLSLGSFYGEGADSMQVAGILPGFDGFWAVRFVATGIMLTVTFAYVISKKALELLQEHFDLRTRRSALRMLLLFWLPHLGVGAVAGMVGYGLVSDIIINYLLLFISVTVLVFMFVSFYVSRKVLPTLKVIGIERKGVFATLVAFLLVLSVWFVAFGVAPSTAHGILLKEPPVEEEIVYTESYAVNLHISIDSDYNIIAEVRLKAFGDINSPLEEAIWATFEERPYWDAYDLVGKFVAKSAFNVSGWSIINHSMGAHVHGMGEIWSKGKVVALEPMNRNASLFQQRNGDMVLYVYDPWKSERGPGRQYVDAINISWDESIQLRSYPRGGGLDPVAVSTTYVSWIFSSYEEAHIVYELTFS